MKNLPNILLTLLIFTASAIGLWMLGKWVFIKFNAFNWSAISKTFVIGLIAFILCVSWIANTINKVAKNLLLKEQFSVKRNLYKACFQSILQAPENSNPAQEMNELYEELLLIADPKVIQAFQNWQKANTDMDSNDSQTELELDRLLFAMRKDLGVSNQSLLLGNLQIRDLKINPDSMMEKQQYQ